MFFPFSSFFFVEEFGWDAMTEPSDKTKPGTGMTSSPAVCRLGEGHRRKQLGVPGPHQGL